MSDEAAAAIMVLVRELGAGKSICPTEAARVLGQGEWRRHLPAVRSAAVALAQSGSIDILRKGRVIAPEAVHGVIRLRLREETEKN